MQNHVRSLKAAERSEIINTSLKAIFVNKKIHIFNQFSSIKGTCVDIVLGDFCLKDATYELVSSTNDFSIKDKSSYLIIPKAGKTIALMED